MRGEGALVGLAAFRDRYGSAVVVADFRPIGAPRRTWRQTLLSDGFVMVRHPSWDEILEMAHAAAHDIRLYAG